MNVCLFTAVRQFVTLKVAEMKPIKNLSGKAFKRLLDPEHSQPHFPVDKLFKLFTSVKSRNFGPRAELNLKHEVSI